MYDTYVKEEEYFLTNKIKIHSEYLESVLNKNKIILKQDSKYEYTLCDVSRNMLPILSISRRHHPEIPAFFFIFGYKPEYNESSDALRVRAMHECNRLNKKDALEFKNYPEVVMC